MSVTENHDNERAATVAMASSLSLKTDELFEHNDALVAENDSLRTAFAAVASENEHLRREREKLVRQRDSAMRKAELAESKLKVIGAEATSYFNAAHATKQDAAVVKFAPPAIRNGS